MKYGLARKKSFGDSNRSLRHSLGYNGELRRADMEVTNVLTCRKRLWTPGSGSEWKKVNQAKKKKSRNATLGTTGIHWDKEEKERGRDWKWVNERLDSNRANSVLESSFSWKSRSSRSFLWNWLKGLRRVVLICLVSPNKGTRSWKYTFIYFLSFYMKKIVFPVGRLVRLETQSSHFGPMSRRHFPRVFSEKAIRFVSYICLFYFFFSVSSKLVCF